MGRDNSNKVWIESDELFSLQSIKKEHKKLPVAVFLLCQDIVGNKFLQKLEDQFQFDYKMYGLETSLIDRVLKTFKGTSGNLGILLNGIKGTGKTVTSKIICNELRLPVILLDSNLPDGHLYLNDIPQDITIFIDEYEKIFNEDADMLTIMDGAFNSTHRRMFVLTTNKLYVNENLIQRPGRIRYLKTFKDLDINIITEIVNDVVIHKHLIADTIRFVSALELITVDIVKAVCQEVNIHEESPDVFEDVFNVKKLSGKYDVFILGDDGKNYPFETSAKMSGARPDFEDRNIGSSFYVNDDYVGEIYEVVDEKTVRTKQWMDSDHPEYDYYTHSKEPASKVRNPFGLTERISSSESKPLSSMKVQDLLPTKKKRKNNDDERPSKMVLRTFSVEKSYMTHRNFSSYTF
jgi:SpoVK/Ycf46/Vps4 family AAA+-type ATPase